MRTVQLAILILTSLLGLHPAVAEQYWYYCDPAHAYYPYVSTCPVPWRAVVPSTAPSASATPEHPAKSAPIPLTPSPTPTPSPSPAATATPAAPSGQAEEGANASSHDELTAVPNMASSAENHEDSGEDNWGTIVTGVAVILFLLWLGIRRIRYQSLVKKYGSADVAKAIMRRRIWQGMSKNQLFDSRGRPVEIGREIYKQTTRETFKYDQTGRNQFRTRVYVENGIVVGWKTR